MAKKSTARALPPPANESGIRFETDQEEANATILGQQGGYTFPGLVLGQPGVVAEINHGRWLVTCPHCRSARNVHPDRLWWCPACGAGAVDVIWPADAYDICAVLACRPMNARNWSPTEPVPGRGRIGPTPVDLAVENLERGVDIPPRLRAAVDAFCEADWIARGLADEMAGFLGAVA
jgi:hypothetical protein